MSTTTSGVTDPVGNRINQILASNGGASAGAADVTDSAGTEDRFLKLLVAQMNNQDPLNPLDNAQMTSQLAQINTVRGIEKLNDQMAKLASASGVNSPLDAIGLIGRKVLAPGSGFERAADTTGATRLGFELAGAADSVQIDIVDATGATVFSKTLSGTAAGQHVFDWNGMDNQGKAAAAGSYQLKVSAASAGNAVKTTTMTPAQVLGVSEGADGVQVELAGRPAMAASAVRTVL
ncbi:MAG: flagellar hook assembly protein FlgD [Burkholderiaceae bacterium]|nr:MAG: flagellar hook assembly protein FlgD [Burkholderiaceae bacterium]